MFKRKPKSLEGLRFLEDQLKDAGNLEEVIKRLEQIVDKDPNFALAWSLLSTVYMNVGRAKDAEKAAATALSLKPDDPQAQMNFVGAQFDVHEDLEGTIKRLEEIVNKDPNFALAWSFLSTAYMYARRLKEAQRAGSTAVSLGRDNAWCHFNLSTIYFVPLCNSRQKGLSFKAELRELEIIGGPEAIERLKRVDPSLVKYEDVEVPAVLEELTLEELGCSYEYARQMAEKHAREAMKLSTDKTLTEGAKERLVTLRMMDELYGKKGDKQPF